jgi:outer membrane protein OmpA-like peptidoglycan-associated protein
MLRYFITSCSLAILWGQAETTPSAAHLTARSITAIGYFVDAGTTSVNLKSTGLIANAEGKARVRATPGVTTVNIEVQGLTPPTRLGAEFLTYVFWAVSPEGRAANLGAATLDDKGRGRIKATTHLQSFSLFVTAEPYSVVRQPSEMLVLENELRKDTKGRVFPVNEYKLMTRAQYQKLGNPLALSMDLRRVPLEMYEARNAVGIAKSRAADQYASMIFRKAEAGLKMAESALSRKASRKEIVSLARQASQFAEDARAFATDRQEQERIAQERAAAAAAAKAEAEAKAAAEAAAARRKADEEARHQAELAAAREARLRAEASARQAQMRAEAEIAATQARAEADRLQAQREAARAETERVREAAAALRAQLLEQFNRILETRDTPRGLVITMADVLFASGRHELKPVTREKLAKVTGMLIAHPGLNLAIEGHTDNTGSDALNQRLSERRAQTVRDYLMTQGMEERWLMSRGFGKTMPVASNDTAAGRQQNRRVELIVWGEVIGVRIGRSY